MVIIYFGFKSTISSGDVLQPISLSGSIFNSVETPMDTFRVVSFSSLIISRSFWRILFHSVSPVRMEVVFSIQWVLVLEVSHLYHVILRMMDTVTHI